VIKKNIQVRKGEEGGNKKGGVGATRKGGGDESTETSILFSWN